MRGWNRNASSTSNGGDSRGTASSIILPMGTPRKPSLRVCLALSLQHPAGSTYDPRTRMANKTQAGRDIPYAITDSAEAVWTVTPPEDASEVEATCARSKTAGEGETPCVLLA